MDKTKPFGLIISKRSKSFRPTTSAVFASDSDDEPVQKKMPKIPQAKPIKAAPTEDPSIYEYDSIYDEMKSQEVAKIAPKDTSKPSKYIGSLLKAADKRKKDQERRVEKKVHHEREKEGDKFKDKEAFVTSSYKKKMQEMEEEEERERRENMLNDMMDVTKQKDLNGFYRHFLKQCVGEEKVPVFGERHSVKQEEGIVIKEEKVSDEEGEKTKAEENVDQDTDFGTSSDGENKASDVDSLSNSESPEHTNKVSKKDFAKDCQGERSRSEKVSMRRENANRDLDAASLKDHISDKNLKKSRSDIDKKVTIANFPARASLLDEDVDRDSDNSSSEEECPKKVGLLKDINKQSPEKGVDEDIVKKRKRSPEKSGKSRRNIRKRTEDADSLSDESCSGSEDGKSGSKENSSAKKQPKISSNGEEKDTQPKKTREDIFAKRTVGEVFAEAQARYFQRMAARSE